MTQNHEYIKIFLVCDNEPDVANIKARFEDSTKTPCYVWSFPSLSEGLYYLDTKKLRADIIILDLGLIGTDNPKEIYEKIGEAACGIPIIVITGKGKKEHDLAVLVMQAGAADNMIRGEFSGLVDAMEFALIRQEIAENTKSDGEKNLKHIKEKSDEKHKDLLDKRLKDKQEYQHTLSMFMGDYSASNNACSSDKEK
jgi:FixJ family two-component response regulator